MAMENCPYKAGEGCSYKAGEGCPYKAAEGCSCIYKAAAELCVYLNLQKAVGPPLLHFLACLYLGSITTVSAIDNCSSLRFSQSS